MQTKYVPKALRGGIRDSLGYWHQNEEIMKAQDCDRLTILKVTESDRIKSQSNMVMTLEGKNMKELTLKNKNI